MNNYLREQKDKILSFARDLHNTGDISKHKLDETYFFNFIMND